jgi:hypothetical protein
LATPQAKPYEVVGSDELSPSNGRTAKHWHIVSESSTFEEHAHTVARAAGDLHREHGLDLTQVSLYPSRSLAGSGVMYGYGFYAADGRAGQGLSGADPDYRATWSVSAADRVLTPEELAVAELWIERAPEFPSKDLLSSLGIDQDALRAHISEELGFPFEDVQLPHLELERWLVIAE